MLVAMEPHPTLLTQNLFEPAFDAERIERVDIPTSLGPLFDDSAMFERDDRSQGFVDISKVDREIIDEDNLHRDGALLMPAAIGKLLPLVLNDPAFLNSARCFHAGLTMRRVIRSSGIHAAPVLVGNELLSYVSAIEAVVTSQDKHISCPACGADVNCGPGHIVRSFKEFISDRSDGNELLEEAFADLYVLRSKFVHEGRSVYRLDQPMGSLPVHMNKNASFSPFPEHYFNLHEWTGFLLRRHLYWSLKAATSAAR